MAGTSGKKGAVWMTHVDGDPPASGPREKPLRHRGHPRPRGGGGCRPGPADEGRGAVSSVKQINAHSDRRLFS